MRHRRSRTATAAEWPAALRYLIRAAELECPPGHAAAPLDLTALAFRKVPARGLFDPAARGDDELFAAIESVARAHLEMNAARASWRATLGNRGLTLQARDDIERAALEVQTVSDTVYFYAGLAFGLVSAHLHGG
jgi:hypothetical protein